jgi:hypothetical protein
MEKLTATLTETVAKAKLSADAIADLKKEAVPPAVSYGAELYYPVMYFVDKDYKDVASTCGGKSLGKPILGGYEGCAGACEAFAGKCVGFSYMAGGLCFLFSEMTTATYYTGCEQAKSGALLQLSGEHANLTKSTHFLAKKNEEHATQESQQDDYYEVEGPKEDNYADYYDIEPPKIDFEDDYGDSMEELDSISDVVDVVEEVTDDYYSVEDDEHGFSCVVKFAKFEGTTLKPDPSGKCDTCLKEAAKADRCPE